MPFVKSTRIGIVRYWRVGYAHCMATVLKVACKPSKYIVDCTYDPTMLTFPSSITMSALGRKQPFAILSGQCPLSGEKRTFGSSENSRNSGPLTARSGHRLAAQRTRTVLVSLRASGILVRAQHWHWSSALAGFL